MTQNISVLREVTEANSLLAEALRARFAEADILVLNMIASPGAGKTTLLERTFGLLGAAIRFAVVEGDPTTSLDAERIANVGVPVVQINTGGGCHLEARAIHTALGELSLDQVDVVIIENVGNLLCPTGWDLGEDIKVVVASLPEGDDKPLKYPMAFATAGAAVINKIDLAPYLPIDVAVLRRNALQINPDLDVYEVSCLTGEGLDGWGRWIQDQLARKRARR